MTIGFIGAGRMGGPICRHLVAGSGHEVAVFDPNPEAVRACTDAGAKACDTIAELAATSEVIFTSLRMPADVEAVALGPGGIAQNAAQGSTFIDLTSNSPAVLRRVAGELAAHGISTLDAPLTGGPRMAESGDVGVLVGGDEEVFAKHRPQLELFSHHVLYLGATGSGMIAKLINNMVSMSNVAVAAEGFMLGASAGLDVGALANALREGDGDSLSLRALSNVLASRDFSSSFGLELAYKDLHLALELSDELGVPTPCAAVTHNLLRMARGLGFDEQGAASVIRVYEQTLGREVNG